MKPITHQELCYYINNRIKMILSRSLHLTHIKIGVNKSNTLFIVNLDYEFCNKKKIFLKQYDLDKSDLDKSIYKAIDDLDTLMN